MLMFLFCAVELLPCCSVGTLKFVWKNLVLVSGIECSCTKDLERHFEVLCFAAECVGMWW